MRILVAGLAKTGTTGLMYLVVNSFAETPQTVFEPTVFPDRLKGSQRDIVAKVLIGPNLEAKSFSHFDKKITITRDPRDRMVSALLYSQFHANYLSDDKCINMVRECLERKERDPRNVSLGEILAVINQVSGRPKASASYRNIIENTFKWFAEYVKAVPEGFFYKYEEFVSGKYDELEKYLGIDLTGVADVPDRLLRVKRTKQFGDWRNWLTDEDVAEYRGLVQPWLAQHGYDANDWSLNAKPKIDRSHCSEYFLRLVEEHRHNLKNPKPQVLGREPGTMVGRILRAEPNIVAGWAIGENFHKPLTVSLLVNGKEVAQVVADFPRPGLRDRGTHPTGKCGFIFRFPGERRLSLGDEVAVRPGPDANNFSLGNSPCTIEKNSH